MGWSSGDRYERKRSLPKAGTMGGKKTALRKNCQKLEIRKIRNQKLEKMNIGF